MKLDHKLFVNKIIVKETARKRGILGRDLQYSQGTELSA